MTKELIIDKLFALSLPSVKEAFLAKNSTFGKKEPVQESISSKNEAISTKQQAARYIESVCRENRNNHQLISQIIAQVYANMHDYQINIVNIPDSQLARAAQVLSEAKISREQFLKFLTKEMFPGLADEKKQDWEAFLLIIEIMCKCLPHILTKKELQGLFIRATAKSYRDKDRVASGGGSVPYMHRELVEKYVATYSSNDPLGYYSDVLQRVINNFGINFEAPILIGDLRLF